MIRSDLYNPASRIEPSVSPGVFESPFPFVKVSRLPQSRLRPIQDHLTVHDLEALLKIGVVEVMRDYRADIQSSLQHPRSLTCDDRRYLRSSAC